MTFELPLTEARVKPHQVTALHLMAALLMTGSGAVLSMAVSPVKTWTVALLIAGLALLGMTLFRNRWLAQAKVNRLFRISELLIVLCLASYFAINSMKLPAIMCGIMAAAILFAIFWEQQTAAVTVRIDDGGIKLPATSRRRQLDWREIEQVLLRFGTLTINCYDNRLFQWTVGSIVFDKVTFETFCNTHIEAGRLKRDPNDW